MDSVWGRPWMLKSERTQLLSHQNIRCSVNAMEYTLLHWLGNNWKTVCSADTEDYFFRFSVCGWLNSR